MTKTCSFSAAAFCLFTLIACFTALPAPAQGPYVPVQTTVEDLTVVAQGKVTEIVKPDLIRLDNDLLYALDNIRVPVLYSEAALAWLDQNLLGKPVVIRANPAPGYGGRDRMGNQVGHIVMTDPTVLWVQGAMVEEGLAWTDGSATNRDLIVPLLQKEEIARAGSRGFWAASGMAPRPAERIGAERDAFMVVEGQVLNTADKRTIFFANFGEDWKTDFTLSAMKEALSAFPADKKITSLDGKKVRIRGWVSERNGPMIEATYPEQIEILDSPAPSTP